MVKNLYLENYQAAAFKFPPLRRERVKAVASSVKKAGESLTAKQSRINRFRNSIKVMSLITDVFCFVLFCFFTGTSNFNVSSRIKTQYVDSRFVYF